jgi:hypothetical protein
MKKLILTAVLSVASVAAFGQGTIDLLNIAKTSGFVSPIFQPNPAQPGTEQVGQPSTSVYTGALPAGTTVYGGLPVTSAYDMVLLYSLSGTATSPGQMSVATIVPFRTATTASASPAGGILAPGAIPIPGTTGGTTIQFEIGAFYVDPTVAAAIAAGGSTPASIYAAALADFNGGDGAAQLGWGSIVSGIQLGGSDTAGGPHVEPATIEGWTSFSLMVTPEPSTFVLAGLGAAGLLLFRRRK